jgi:hypothetical protein
MRADMAKVIVERPRSGSRLPSVKTARRIWPRQDLEDFDSGPSRRSASMGSPGNSKWLNEHLGPLRRFLRSNVGRPWDKVYSEISAALGQRNALVEHVFFHLEGYVCENVEIRDGVAYHADVWRGAKCTFYVHPRTGILLYQQYKRKVAWGSTYPKDWVAGNEPFDYLLHDGCWFRYRWRWSRTDDQAAFDAVHARWGAVPFPWITNRSGHCRLYVERQKCNAAESARLHDSARARSVAQFNGLRLGVGLGAAKPPNPALLAEDDDLVGRHKPELLCQSR